MRYHKIALSCALALASSAALADGTLIPISDFARRADYTGADLSPNGEYVSVRTPYEDRHALTIIKLSGDYSRSVIRFPDGKETVAGAVWSDNNRLIVSKAIDIGSLTTPLLDGNIYTVDADSGKQEQIFGYLPDSSNKRSRLKDEGTTYLLRTIPNSGGDALFVYHPWLRGNSDNVTTVFRATTTTGTRRQLDSIRDDVSFAADNAGVPRLMWGQNLDGTPWMKYRPTSTEGSEWLPVPKSLTERELWISHFEPDNKTAYAWINDRGEADALYRIDLATGTRTPVLSKPDMTSADMEYGGYDGGPFAVLYNNARPKLEYIDQTSEWTKLHAGLMKLFAGQLVEFVSFSKDNKKVLFFVHSDRNPGAYYLFDRTTNQPALLFQTMEWIDPAKMSPTRPIEFKNAAGVTLSGLYTAPLGKSGPQPLIVMPHGGPYGVYDSWGFDTDVQFLASRGYAVLQVNYRGSGGRGDLFTQSTYRQWGTGIQDDISDGVKWAIAQGLADGNRVCTYGISFGGYSALMNPIRNPGMYKCAIGYAGVYDLVESVKEDSSGAKQTAAFFERSMGSDKAELASQSPARRVSEINVPVLLIHGKSDKTAPFEQFSIMEAALKKAGKSYESLAVPDEGHGFYDVKNREEAYRRVEAFLRKYNPVN